MKGNVVIIAILSIVLHSCATKVNECGMSAPDMPEDAAMDNRNAQPDHRQEEPVVAVNIHDIIADMAEEQRLLNNELIHGSIDAVMKNNNYTGTRYGNIWKKDISETMSFEFHLGFQVKRGTIRLFMNFNDLAVLQKYWTLSYESLVAMYGDPADSYMTAGGEFHRWQMDEETLEIDIRYNDTTIKLLLGRTYRSIEVSKFNHIRIAGQE